jgi:hypothetical protein
MEENFQSKPQRELVFSKSVKAGKRIYYFDVKRTRAGNDLFVSITESKKITGGTEQNPQFSFQKQKFTIYREDLKNFADAVKEIAEFVEQAGDIESIDNQPNDSQDFDIQSVEDNKFYAEKTKGKEKFGNKFKALFDNIFSDI